jgi:hypothetical protein
LVDSGALPAALAESVVAAPGRAASGVRPAAV